MTVSELLNTEPQWGQGLSASRDGTMCLLEAIYAAYTKGGESAKVVALVKKYLSLSYDNSIVFWNDHPQRTFADVRQVIEALDI